MWPICRHPATHGEKAANRRTATRCPRRPRARPWAANGPVHAPRAQPRCRVGAAVARRPRCNPNRGPTCRFIRVLPASSALDREARADIKLLVEVKTCLRLVSVRGRGRIEFQPTDTAPTDLAAASGPPPCHLATGTRWAISIANGGGAPTSPRPNQAIERDGGRSWNATPLLQAVKAAFPQARNRQGSHPRRTAGAGARPRRCHHMPDPEDMPEDWDPFDDE